MSSQENTPGPALDSLHNAQWWLLYAVLVSNKSAEFANKKLNLMIHWDGSKAIRPFERVRYWVHTNSLRGELTRAKTGQYNRIESAFEDLTVRLPPVVGGDPRTWSLMTLESIPGVGPKTARWYYGLTHPEAAVAALDTHILKFLRDNGVDAPKNTPPAGKTYERLETDFILFASELSMAPPTLDYLLWQVYRKGGHVILKGKGNV